MYKLPWRIGIGLAVLSFLVLHFVADIFEEPSSAANTGGTGSELVQSAMYTLAMILQFIVPIGLSIAAAVSFLKQSKGFGLFEAVEDDTPSVVRQINWRDFEALICEGFRREGYRVEERGGSGPDGAIDLIATKAKKRLLIQCKDWKNPLVGVMVIRELHAIVMARRADGGVAITGGVFTKEARDLAKNSAIRLIDGDELQRMIGAPQSDAVAPPSLTVEAAAAPRKSTAPAGPQCPKCRAEMVERVAKQGKFAGRQFWVCSQYPKCTGIASAFDPQEAVRRSQSAA
ncbi:MAG: restriction endonuclease [Steroidobacteraceae bacterium]